MDKKVQFVIGSLCGIVVPGITWLVFGVMYKDLVFFDKPAFPYLMVIVINLFIVRYLIRSSKEFAGYVVLAITFIFMVTAFMFKIKL